MSRVLFAIILCSFLCACSTEQVITIPYANILSQINKMDKKRHDSAAIYKNCADIRQLKIVAVEPDVLNKADQTKQTIHQLVYETDNEKLRKACESMFYEKFKGPMAPFALRSIEKNGEGVFTVWSGPRHKGDGYAGYVMEKEWVEISAKFVPFGEGQTKANVRAVNTGVIDFYEDRNRGAEEDFIYKLEGLSAPIED